MSALPIFFVAMAVVDGMEPIGHFGIITNYLNITRSFDTWFQQLEGVKSENITDYVHITVIMSHSCAASKSLLASKIHNYNYVETKLVIMRT